MNDQCFQFGIKSWEYFKANTSINLIRLGDSKEERYLPGSLIAIQ